MWKICILNESGEIGKFVQIDIPPADAQNLSPDEFVKKWIQMPARYLLNWSREPKVDA
jgi:hypothetical protein